VFQKSDGTTLTSTGHSLEIKLWSTGPSGGTALCDTTVPAPTFALDNSGRFSVQLDESCTPAVGGNPGAFVEILLDGTTLGRTKLGAVPYAIEAKHAVSADSASNALTTILTSEISATEGGKSWADHALHCVSGNGAMEDCTTAANWKCSRTDGLGYKLGLYIGEYGSTQTGATRTIACIK
jgi:hypothetical protein